MFSIKIDLDLTILSLAIVFPLVFSITSGKVIYSWFSLSLLNQMSLIKQTFQAGIPPQVEEKP